VADHGPISRNRAAYESDRYVGCPVGSRKQTLFGRPFYTPYWTTFELPPIDVKVASVGMLDRIVAGLKVTESPGKPGRFSAYLGSFAGSERVQCDSERWRSRHHRRECRAQAVY